MFERRQRTILLILAACESSFSFHENISGVIKVRRTFLNGLICLRHSAV